MLTQLTISNFAIVEYLEINLRPGLIVLTGETGAGKSIIVDALDFLLGARANVDLIKTGAEKAKVEGTFLLPEKLKPILLENDFEVGSQGLIISREISNYGSKTRINGIISNISFLSFLREKIIEIHSQGEQLELLRVEKHLQVLDGFGDVLHKKLIEEYRDKYQEFIELKNKLKKIKDNVNEINKKTDFFKFQINEIKSANIKDLNEEDELKEKRGILLNKKELSENSNLVYEILNKESGLLNDLSKIKKLLLKSLRHDKLFEQYLSSIENIEIEIKDLSSFVSSYLEGLSDSKDNLNEVEERLDLFYSLKRKYGGTLANVKDYYEKVQDELFMLEKQESSVDDLENKFKEKGEEIKKLACSLTKSREKITRIFVDRINEELKSLGFNEGLFVVKLTPIEMSEKGDEQVEFLFTANPDEPPKPLLKVVSGGELSRIVLAIKSIICANDKRNMGSWVHGFEGTKTMVFDEVDIGVSGEIASNVATKLYKISKFNQVICITHNPIIASMGDNHIMVEKTVQDGVTKVTAREINYNEKAEALVMLLAPEKGAREISLDAREFAESLLENARKMKKREFIAL